VLHGPVLVVEDDVDVRTVITEVLREEGFQVIAADDGREALDLLSVDNLRPAVVLLDLALPHLSGPDLLAAARSLVPGFEDVPVVVMSGMGPSNEPRPRLPGVRAWLDKPFELDDLLAALLSVTAFGAEPTRKMLARRLLRYLARHGELPRLRRALADDDFELVAAIAVRITETGRHFAVVDLVRAGETVVQAAAHRQAIAVATGIRRLANVVLALQGTL
jgi:two-component system response regulator CpxR